jgi:dihydrofolate reductase
VTSQTGPLGWNATRLEGLDTGLGPAVRKLKEGDGGPILVAGSSTLVQALLAEGVVDELRLLVFPIAIGGGLRVFPDDRGKIELQLDELVRYESGVLLQVYRPAGGR